MASDRVKPNFLLVGAGKSATRSLYNYLIQHPDVFMPSLKEPQFFVAREVAGRIQKWVDDEETYFRLFAPGAGKKAIGEASVMYLLFYQEAIKNILHYLGNQVRIMMILRNPVDRAYSAYNFVHLNNPAERYSFEEALQLEEERWRQKESLFMQYKRMGLYADAVQAYLNHFPHVHIMWYDEFRQNPAQVLKGVFEFLGLRSDVPIDYSKVWNKGGRRWKNPLIRWLLMSDNWIKRILKMFFPRRRGVRTHAFFTQNFMQQIEPMKPETRKMLIEYFRADILRLQQITGRDLSSWLQ
ncbi:MAG: sulfotransferase domain-containing protein [Chitinophagales bacterium]|nr:sulfotransferase domain-containing protein [Chitinophagales bacterium]MDW8427884.1 sulfotransferase domain-containing protein [Chitinophagales bacterium]